MAESPVLENESGKEEVDESFFSVIDILLLGGLLAFAIFYLWRKTRSQENQEASAPKSYSIQ